MSEPESAPNPPIIGFERRWRAWDAGPDAGHTEYVAFRWENEGWTIEGRLPHAEVDYVMRLGSDGEVRQFMLFRDLDEPDLWLAHDGRGTWGEVNGAARPDLDGCTVVGPADTMLLLSLPIRRLGVWASDSERFSARLGVIDVETLGVVAHEHDFVRVGAARWAINGQGRDLHTDVDDDYIVVDVAGLARRLPVTD